MKLLLTAFDPFGGDKVNPALEAVRLVSEKVGNVEVVKLEVPTVFRKSIATVATAIAKEKPDVFVLETVERYVSSTLSDFEYR